MKKLLYAYSGPEWKENTNLEFYNNSKLGNTEEDEPY